MPSSYFSRRCSTRPYLGLPGKPHIALNCGFKEADGAEGKQEEKQVRHRTYGKQGKGKQEKGPFPLEGF